MRILLFLFVASMFASCSPSLSPFTQRLYKENNWSEKELKRIQFYVSDDIILHRELRQGQSRIVSGEIKMINGKRVEEVIIPAGTPGVLQFMPDKNRFAVSFESGSDRYLVFGPDKDRGGKYVLLAKEWKKRYGLVTYDGRQYSTPAGSAFASLMVDLKAIKNVEVRRRTAEGVKVR